MPAQGTLTPPGAPAATMKTLDQIEARTPISSAPYTITNSGSYYLTTNLSVSSGSAIIMNTTSVTLDLNGFTIFSTAASLTGYGINLNQNIANGSTDPSDVTIYNGHICGNFLCGIDYSYPPGPSPYQLNMLVSKVSVSGVSSNGIYLGCKGTLSGYQSVVEACTVNTAGTGTGITASTVKNSIVSCSGTGIYGDQVSDCRGYSSGTGSGIYATLAVQNSSGESGSGTGIHTGGNALNCHGKSNGNGCGVYAAFNAQNCYGESSSGIGVQATIAVNCAGYSFSETGIKATTATSCWIQHGTTNITFKYLMPP